MLHPDARLGLASHELSACDALPPITTPWVAQIEYNGINRGSAARTAALLRRRGWTIWAMQPLAYGFLGGKHGADANFSQDDWRSAIDPSRRAVLASLAEGFLAPLRRAFPGRPAAELAVAFCLADAALERVVVGPRTPAQLNDALSALTLAEDDAFRREAERSRGRS
jgi:aryl-alcohol dehydrogenase-like predicted oxidoreductase